MTPVPPNDRRLAASSPEAALLAAYDLFRDTADLSRVFALVLFLVSSSVTRPETRRAFAEPDAFQEILRAAVPTDAAPLVPAWQDMRPEAVRQLVQAVGRTVAAAGAGPTFQSVLSRYAAAAGRRSLWTPTSSAVAALLARLIASESATTVYDPACRAGELLIEVARRGGPSQVSVRAVTRHRESRALSQAALDVHGITSEISQSEYPWLSTHEAFSRVVCNPPFSLRLPEESVPDAWSSALPPSRADFIWLLHAKESLEPGGIAAVLMPHGTLFRRGKEEELRKKLIDDEVVEALVVLPAQMLPEAGIPTVVWLLRPRGESRREVLFVDASALGTLTDRTHRTFDERESSAVVELVERWRATGAVTDPGLGISVPRTQIRAADYLLIPAHYRPEPSPDDVPGAAALEEIMARLRSAEAGAEAADTEARRLLEGLRWQ